MNPNEPTAAPVSLDELVDRCMGEIEFAQKVLENFIDSCDAQLDAIYEDLKADDRTGCAKKIHRLRGTAATIAAKPLKAYLEELESCVEHADTSLESRGGPVLESVRSECQRIATFVHDGFASP